MKEPIPQHVMNDHLQMGFQEQIIKMAWLQAEKQSELMELIISLTEQNNNYASDFK
jgi:hypothetical protein